MRRIIMSLGAIVFVAAAAIGATGAFFSDTETSSANTFAAGALDLKVDDTQHYAGLVCKNVSDSVVAVYHWVQDPNIGPNPTTRPDLLNQPCTGTWALKDLDPSNQFFNYGDVKPGDPGENTVSLHVDNNAWACLNIHTDANNENNVNGPEILAGDDASSSVGELAQNVSVITWLDQGATPGFQGANDPTEGDNIHQVNEPILSGPISLAAFGATTTLTLADGGTGTPLPGGSTSYVGIAWCVGTQTVDGTTGAISCNGAPVGNIIQTDSATATVSFHVEQARNNPTFRCNAPVIVGANDLAPNLQDALTDGKWFFYNDTNDTLNNALGAFVAGPLTPPLGTGSAFVNPLADATGRTVLATAQFGGTPLSSINALSFSDFSPVPGTWSANEAPFVRFNVDFNNNPAYQNSLVYVPSVNGAVTQGAWQNWDMISGGTAKWNYSGAFWPAGITTVANTVPGTTARTWASILADYPAIKMHATFPFIGMRVGEPGPAGYNVNLDNFSITIGGINKTFNFGN